MKRYLLFDLDGTLSDTGPGILTSARYALSSLGLPKPTDDELRRLIGPPFNVGLAQFYGVEGEQNRLTTRQYRAHYREHGVYESELYPGIKELLERLKANVTLCVATSKPEQAAHTVLKLRGIESLFSVVVGSPSELEGSTKAEIINTVLEQLHHPPKEEIIMIGDRFYDIEGAKSCGIASIGVEYGFSSPGELQTAGADYVVKTVEELGKLLEEFTHEA